jgi:hypothetical protein
MKKQKKRKCSSHKSTRMSNISCERQKRKDTRQRNKRFEEKKMWVVLFLLAMTDAICAPEEKTKDKIQKTVQHQLGSLL